MLLRIIWAAVLLGLGLQTPFAMQEKPASSPGGQKEKEDPLSRFHWLSDSSGTRGMVFSSGKLTTVKIDPREQTSTEIETEIVRPGASSMRITRNVFDRGANGERRLAEVVTEDLRTTAGGGVSATRTVSRLDLNGRMKVVRKDTQETVSTGPDSYRTQATSMVARGNEALARSEEIVQVEKRKGEGSFEFERNRLMADVNGAWVTADKSLGSVREASGQVQIQEDFYRQGINGKLSLDRREGSREYKDQQGRMIKDTDVFRPDAAGNLQLNERSNITQAAAPDGSEQTTQSIYQKSAVAPSEGLKLNKIVVQTSRQSEPGTTVKDTIIQVPDGNGKFQTMGFVRVFEKK